MGNRQYQAGHIFLKVIYLQEKHTLKQNLLKSMNPDIWFLGILINSLFIRSSKSKSEIKILKKYSLYSLYLSYHWLLIYGSFRCKWCFQSKLKKSYSSSLKKVFLSQKICFKVKILKEFKIFTANWLHSVHWGLKPPPSKTPPSSFLPCLPLNQQSVQAPFLGNLPLYISFLGTPLKVRFFSEPVVYTHPSPRWWVGWAIFQKAHIGGT